MSRRWFEGWSGEIGGVRFRIVQGVKSPEDLRLDWLVEGSWIAVPMKVGGFLADFFCENEDILYPPPAKGGRKYIEYLRWSARHGVDKAQAGLEAEQYLRNKDRQERPPLFDPDDPWASSQ